MKDFFVPYNIALGLKEIGFGEICIAYYRIDEVERTGDIMLCYTPRGKDIDHETLRHCDDYKKHLKAEHVCSCVGFMYKHRFVAVAPTWDQAFSWFREKHGLICEITYEIENFYFNIKCISNKYDNYDILLYLRNRNEWEFKSYEEAQLACIQKMIEKCKTIS